MTRWYYLTLAAGMVLCGVAGFTASAAAPNVPGWVVLLAGAPVGVGIVRAARWADGRAKAHRLRRAVNPPAPAAHPAGDVERLMDEIVAEHTAHYHPGRPCQENRDGKCADRFGGIPVDREAEVRERRARLDALTTPDPDDRATA